MRIPTLMRAVWICTVLLACVLASPNLADAGSWSPRSAEGSTNLWSHARLIRARPRTEIKPVSRARHQAAPPNATARSQPAPGHSFISELRPERSSPSRDRAMCARSAAARLRTSALPDRRARTAALAALAGVFYEAHAPPVASSTFPS
jgi:hypothetical protein